jgi:hypothetical protein
MPKRACPYSLLPLDSHELQSTDTALQELQQGSTGELNKTPHGQQTKSNTDSKHPLTQFDLHGQVALNPP